jgi:hypothetical protein
LKSLGKVTRTIDAWNANQEHPRLVPLLLSHLFIPVAWKVPSALPHCGWWNYDFKPVYNPLLHPEAGENYLVTNEEAKTRLSSRLPKRFTDISILKQYHHPFGIPPGSPQSGA